MTMRTWAPTGLFIVKWVSPEKLISFRAPWLSLCRHLLLQTNWTLVLITVLCTPVWNSRSRAKTNAKKKKMETAMFWSVSNHFVCATPWCPYVNSRIGKGCVGNCRVRWRKRRCGIQTRGAVERDRISEPPVPKALLWPNPTKTAVKNDSEIPTCTHSATIACPKY